MPPRHLTCLTQVPALLQCPYSLTSSAFGISLAGNLSPLPSLAVPSTGTVFHFFLASLLPPGQEERGGERNACQAKGKHVVVQGAVESGFADRQSLRAWLKGNRQTDKAGTDPGRRLWDRDFLPCLAESSLPSASFLAPLPLPASSPPNLCPRPVSQLTRDFSPKSTLHSHAPPRRIKIASPTFAPPSASV